MSSSVMERNFGPQNRAKYVRPEHQMERAVYGSGNRVTTFGDGADGLRSPREHGARTHATTTVTGRTKCVVFEICKSRHVGRTTK